MTSNRHLNFMFTLGLHLYSVLNVNALVGAFNQENALVGVFNQEKALIAAFSVFLKSLHNPRLREALLSRYTWRLL